MTDRAAGAAGGPAGADAQQRWRPIDASAYVERLERAKALLEQASALAATTEAARVAPLVELERRLREEGRGHTHRRPHR